MRISPSDLCQWTSETLGDSLKVSSSSQKGTWSQFPGDSILIFSLFLPLRSMMLLLSLEIVIVPSFCLPTQWLNLDIFLDSSNLIESYITGKFIGNSPCPVLKTICFLSLVALIKYFYLWFWSWSQHTEYHVEISSELPTQVCHIGKFTVWAVSTCSSSSRWWDWRRSGTWPASRTAGRCGRCTGSVNNIQYRISKILNFF